CYTQRVMPSRPPKSYHRDSYGDDRAPARVPAGGHAEKGKKCNHERPSPHEARPRPTPRQGPRCCTRGAGHTPFGADGGVPGGGSLLLTHALAARLPARG